jgi:hypothetical protein
MEMMKLADDDLPDSDPQKGINQPTILVTYVRRRCLSSHYGRDTPFRL